MKLLLLGITLALLFLTLAGGALGVLVGHPLFTGRASPTVEPVEVVLVPAPPSAIEAPTAR